MHIDGAWRDHLGYAMTSEEVAAEGGLLARWRRLRATRQMIIRRTRAGAARRFPQLAPVTSGIGTAVRAVDRSP